MDGDAAFDGNGCESGTRARARVRGFLSEIGDLLDRADVLAFSHFGAIRALVANLVGLTDAQMMSLDVPNGGAFLFARHIDPSGAAVFTAQPLPEHVLARTAAPISQPPAAPPPS
jgi:broad specificity phosphatase PhoE